MCNVLIKKHTSNINNRKNIKYKEVIQPQVPLRLPCYDFALLKKSRFEFNQRLKPHPNPFWVA